MNIFSTALFGDTGLVSKYQPMPFFNEIEISDPYSRYQPYIFFVIY